MIQHTTPVSDIQPITEDLTAAKERAPVTTFRSRLSALVEHLLPEDREKPDYEKIKADYLKIRLPRRVDPSRRDENLGTGKTTAPGRVTETGDDTAVIPAKGTERGGKGTLVATEANTKSGEASARGTRRSEGATPTTKATGKRREASPSPVSIAGRPMFGVQRRPASVDKATGNNGSSKMSPFIEDIPEPPLITAAKAASEKEKAEAAANNGGTTTDNATRRTRSATKPIPGFRLGSAAGIEPRLAAKNEAANTFRAAAAKNGGAAMNHGAVSDDGANEHEVLIRKGSTARSDAGRHHRRTSSLRGPTKYRPGPPPGTELIKQPGRQASLRAYWDHRRDGMWDVTWEGGLDHGFDVMICIIYIKLS